MYTNDLRQLTLWLRLLMKTNHEVDLSRRLEGNRSRSMLKAMIIYRVQFLIVLQYNLNDKQIKYLL